MRISKYKVLVVSIAICMFLINLNNSTIYHYFFDEYTIYFAILAGLLLICALPFAHDFLINKKDLSYFFVFIIFISFSSFIRGITSDYITLLLYIVLLFLIVFLSKGYNIDYMKLFFIVSLVFSIWGLINYLYFLFDLSFVPLVKTSEILSWTRDVNLYGYVLCKPRSDFAIGGFTLYRLDAPFGEPGIMQMYSNYCVAYLLFFDDQVKYRKQILVISIITSILSFSLIGIIILTALSFLYFFKQKNTGLMVLFGSLMMIAVILMITEKTTSVSYLDRSSDYGYMIKQILEWLPFGIGIGHNELMSSNFVESIGRNAIGGYCGLLTPLLNFGLFGIVYYIYLYKAIVNCSVNFYSKISLAILFLLTLFTEPQAMSVYVLGFLMWGIFIHKKRKRNVEYYE